MNITRRWFLKAIGWATAATVAPAMSEQVVTASQPSDVDGLIAWMENNFNCAMGEPWHVADVKRESLEKIMPDGKLTWDAYVTTKEHGTPYIVYCLTTEDVDGGREKLVAAMRETFSGFIKKYPHIAGTRLWWRHEEKIMMETEYRQNRGELWMTREEWRDAGEPDLPDNVEQDFENFYHKGTPASRMAVIYCRIAIPALQAIDDALDDVASIKPEVCVPPELPA